MDMLCTDKTGTLTEGVVRLDAALDAQGKDSEQVLRLAFLNANYQSDMANPLDEAILQNAIDVSKTNKVDEIPYDFVRKRLSVVVKEEEKNYLVTKGALENVLAVCNSVQAGEQRLELDDSVVKQIHERFTNWSEQGFRVLGVAVKEVASQTDPFHPKDEQGMVFCGFLLFFDPPKEGILGTVQELERLGLQLKIITGDNQAVARHTAQAVGLPDTSLLTGGQIDQLHDEALWHAAERTTIFAEVDPNQKSALSWRSRKPVM
jgi:Mg2+-importing ATPase